MVRLMPDPLNPMSPPSVTYSFNKYLLSSYCVLGPGDEVFALMKLAVQRGRPMRNKKIAQSCFGAVSQAVETNRVMQWPTPDVRWGGQDRLL